ncbi:MAG: four helix bundle protein [Candidatus Berkelbacteria bacterium]|nr:four helix bundle protein [Candidatus Berkelbacteria bacterium]
MIWIDFLPHIPKTSRQTIGARIENKFLDLLEETYITYFSPKEKKVGKICDCILILDTLKFLISIAWEGKIIPNNKFEELAKKLDEVGKMFGGWRRNFDNPEKKNRTL